MGLQENDDLYHFASLMIRGELVSLGENFEDEVPAESCKASFEDHIQRFEWLLVSERSPLR